MRKCTIVAEIGTAHQGDLKKAFRMIDAAGNAGADAAKFQYVIAQEILHPASGDVLLPGGATPLFRVFQSLEKSTAFYSELKSYTESKGMEFLCTPFGIKSARALQSLGIKRLKIASPELNHIPLLEEVAGYNLPLVLSTGVSTLGDIEEALKITGPATLLHCITSYPAPEEEYNINLIPHLAALFGCPVGISDHSRDPLLVPLAALSRGAVMIEKHFTLSRDARGLDDPIALPPEEFEQMCRALERGKTMAQEEILEELNRKYTPRRVEKVLGSGTKFLAPSEESNYLTTNRSIHALGGILAEETLTLSNCAVLRSEKNLRPGIHPRYYKKILGKIVFKDIPPGQGICWEDLLADEEFVE